MIGSFSTAALHPILQLVLRQGAMAFVIKVFAALLGFGMFLVISRVLPAEAFGQFGFAFSLVTMLALVGGLGQRSAILRFAGHYQADPDKRRLNAVIRFGYAAVLGGCLLAAAALVLPALLLPGIPPYFMAAAAFTVVLGLAEYQGHALRTFGSMRRALIPRDILWRLAVIAIVPAGGAFGLWPATAAAALWICTLTLLVITLGQVMLDSDLRGALGSPRDVSPLSERRDWIRAAIGLWGSSIVLAAGPNLAVVILGLLLGPADVGPLFAALRTAMLMSLFLMAANMIAAPLIARHHAAGDLEQVRRLCRFIAILVGVPTTLVFAGLCLVGDRAMALFGPGFESAYPALIILSAGYLASALAGPNTQVMEMAGAERSYFRIIAVTTTLSLLSLPVLVGLLGATGAALGIAANMVASNVWTTRHCVKHLGIQPGLLPVPGTDPDQRAAAKR